MESSIGLITALNPYIGYDNSTRLAREALLGGRSVLELVREGGCWTTPCWPRSCARKT